jgi:hypothetical protein
MSSPNLIASIRQRLRNKAAQADEVFDFVLARYAVERLLYRLSVSNLSNQFVLKGALLFCLWNEQMHRPTRDLDLPLGSARPTPPRSNKRSSRLFRHLFRTMD